MNFFTQIDNLALIALLLVSGIALFLPTLSTLISGKGLSPTEATIWINRRKAYVFDIRAEDAFKAGHLPGAKFAPATALEAEIGKLKLDRKHPVVLICENGNDSRKAVAAVKTLGFAEVAALDGGIVAWKAAALPLVK
ncbi:rhodanese-like domain-containing protein [Polynucleobacter paneuropaeus]|jgi:rhodanese-related sulfurtransferase|uniref:Rhodanese-like domain-containing protein n=1 Tax=Polynucleobacter paneuropaeus TaxID=2527775 RepID=A0A2Z4JUV5_9BURK|nr:rhodanese-like domain-containing protein [Polynucleobacter paneuropaeus]AWW45083.1 rhodanese-like domain-containing protein [Polynucleobacter paneuropaeus]AWW46883.1 rhodanese-like domain-containing protein [Polynucleobacter paneuropaeus]AWW48618.1 rhodanese-like domain-containing protein [Polynucleobacter paneuropaeus]AWW50453.1 rhodanese-like domain-containing protein [Polynucleobacter paneuropaeus]MBT8514853.1 rhodanese-like domain-containing protein [Polynucleobacter paneuropaeus]